MESREKLYQQSSLEQSLKLNQLQRSNSELSGSHEELKKIFADMQSAFQREEAEKKKISADYTKLLFTHANLTRLQKETEVQVETQKRSFEELNQRFVEMESTLSSKITDLEQLCQVKDEQANKQNEELSQQLAQVIKEKEDLTVLAESAKKEAEQLQASLHDQDAALQAKNLAAEDASSKLSWFLGKGVPGIVRAFLHSEDFMNKEVLLQQECVKIGEAEGCLAMKEHYSELLGDAEPLSLRPEGPDNVLNLFSDLINFNYPLLQSFESGSMTFEKAKALVDALERNREDIGESSSAIPPPDPPAS